MRPSRCSPATVPGLLGVFATVRDRMLLLRAKLYRAAVRTDAEVAACSADRKLTKMITQLKETRNFLAFDMEGEVVPLCRLILNKTAASFHTFSTEEIIYAMRINFQQARRFWEKHDTM